MLSLRKQVLVLPLVGALNVASTQTKPVKVQGLTLPQLLDLVERAARGDRELGGQLFEAMRRLAGDPGQPPQMRALGKVLVSILVGERDPNLDGLPPELASAVRGLLARLRG